jgi:hypothetical protein
MYWCDRFGNTFILILTPENIEKDTKYMMVACICTKILNKDGFLVMAEPNLHIPS